MNNSMISVFIKTHSKMLKIFVSILVVGLVSYLAFQEFKTIDLRQVFSLLRGLPSIKVLQIVVLGMASFSLLCIYDLILVRFFKFPLRTGKIVRIALTASAFNFIGFGGLTVGGLRSSLYQKEGIPASDAIKLSLSVLLGSNMGVAILVMLSAHQVLVLKKWYLYLLISVLAIYILAYFFGHLIKVKSRFIKYNPFGLLNYATKGLVSLASVIEWAGAALFFSFLIRMYAPEIPWGQSILVFCIAIMIGTASFMPGGIGGFDMACVFGFGLLGYKNEHIVASLLIYRVVYSILPWLLGILSTAGTFARSKRTDLPESSRERAQTTGVYALYYGIMAAGFILFFSAATPALAYRLGMVRDIVSMMIGVTLVVVARGIKDRLHQVYRLAIVLLIVGAVTTFIKGLDFEEALIVVVLAVLLFSSRQAFDRKSRPFDLRGWIIGIAAFTILPLAFLLLYDLSRGIPLFQEGYVFTLAFIKDSPASLVLYILAVVFLSFFFQYRISEHMRFPVLGEEALAEIEAFLKVYPGSIFAHLAFLGDKQVFFNRDKNVMILYRPYRRRLFVLGDPIGRPDFFEQALDELATWASKHNMSVVFYEISGEKLDLYSSQGYRFLKIGEEAVVELADFTLERADLKDLRNIQHKMAGGTLGFSVLLPPFSPDLYRQIRIVSDEWLAGRVEKRFSMGWYDEKYIGRTPLAVIRHENELIAFATIMPLYDGQSIAIDLMRTKKSPNGAMDALLLGIIEWGRSQGYARLSLGGAPLANVGNDKSSRKKEKLLRYAYEFGSRVYGFQGLREYKDKYRPLWHSRYIAYRRELSIPGILLDAIRIINPKKRQKGPT